MTVTVRRLVWLRILFGRACVPRFFVHIVDSGDEHVSVRNSGNEDIHEFGLGYEFVSVRGSGDENVDEIGSGC